MVQLALSLKENRHTSSYHHKKGSHHDHHTLWICYLTKKTLQVYLSQGLRWSDYPGSPRSSDAMVRILTTRQQESHRQREEGGTELWAMRESWRYYSAGLGDEEGPTTMPVWAALGLPEGKKPYHILVQSTENDFRLWSSRKNNNMGFLYATKTWGRDVLQWPQEPNASPSPKETGLKTGEHAWNCTQDWILYIKLYPIYAYTNLMLFFSTLTQHFSCIEILTLCSLEAVKASFSFPLLTISREEDSFPVETAAASACSFFFFQEDSSSVFI